MILMDLKFDNFMAFNEFEMNMSYPKKIVGNQMVENLINFPNFRYRKLNIMMGSNASGKTSIGKMLMVTMNFIERKEFVNLVSYIRDSHRDASFEVQFVVDNSLYKVLALVKSKNDDVEYSSKDVLVKVNSVTIKPQDSYEKCLLRLEKESVNDYNNDFIKELEKIKRLSWAFEFPRDSYRIAARYVPEDEKKYILILKNTLQALDPLITDVKKVNEAKNTYSITLANDSILIKDGIVIDDDKLSSGTKEGISLASMYAALVCGEFGFFYCDEKFSYIHSDIEKAFLSLMVQRLEGDCQLFFTTHNTDILSMNFPKHSFNFLRKQIFDSECYITVENAGDYVKKNTVSVMNAVQNDLFSSAPMLEKIYELADI